MTIKLAIAGAAGRMGQALIHATDGNPDFTVSGATETTGSRNAVGGDIPVSANAASAAASADVWIDFTAPAATMSALADLSSTPVRAAIIGTTGLSAAEDKLVAEHARRIAIVKAGNFSLGVNLMLALVHQAAERLGDDWDIEIHETHHHHKVDAPSGTALMIGEAAADARGHSLIDLRLPPHNGVTGTRKSGGIGFSVSRAGAVIGDHEAQFASEHEILTIGHRALDRSIFARGALHAAKWAVGRPPGLYSMRDVLSL